jgi:hypothetical protein
MTIKDLHNDVEERFEQVHNAENYVDELSASGDLMNSMQRLSNAFEAMEMGWKEKENG